MSWRVLGFTSKVLFGALNSVEVAASHGCHRVLACNVLPHKNLFPFAGERYRSTFLNSISGEELRHGMIGVSNAGKKKGRLRGKKRIGDLNRGQHIGMGKANMNWPGLNAPAVVRGYKSFPEKMPRDTQREEELIKLRDKGRLRRVRLTPLERGYTGSKLPGQKIGPPDPIGDYTFDGFETIVLEYKTVSTMTGTLGRKMRFSAFAVTGNGNGIGGYGLGKSPNPKTAVRLAKNRAAQNLVYIPRFENHTVYHNMYSQFWRSKIFIHKKEEGYGLRCHRVLKSICQILGIKNLHCKVEASTGNVQNVTKAFFNALINQETHQELAERLGYHIVEMKKEQDYKPRVIASPSQVKKELLVDEVEDLEVDFDRLYYGGKCELPKKPIPWHYLTLPSYLKRQERLHSSRNQYQAAIIRAAGLD